MDMLAIEDFMYFSEEENLDEWHVMDTPMCVMSVRRGNGKSRKLPQKFEEEMKKTMDEVPEDFEVEEDFIPKPTSKRSRTKKGKKKKEVEENEANFFDEIYEPQLMDLETPFRVHKNSEMGSLGGLETSEIPSDKEGHHIFSFKIEEISRQDLEYKPKSKMKKLRNGNEKAVSQELSEEAKISLREQLWERMKELRSTFEQQQIDIQFDNTTIEILCERLLKISGKHKDESELLNSNFVEKQLLGPVLPFLMQTNAFFLFNKMFFYSKGKELFANVEALDFNVVGQTVTDQDAIGQLSQVY